jgi:2-polyprenyl-3-methyl-5-hydroxy-6-metoxy-1,4-benzoquinol methylase
MKCYLCGHAGIDKIADRTRDRADLKVLKCLNCGLVFLESFDHISDHFYESSGMHGGMDGPFPDIHRLRRDNLADDERRFAMFKARMAGKSVLDFGSGPGGFVSLMSQRGVTADIRGIELEARHRNYMREAENLDIRRSIDDFREKFDFITLFHTVEHLKDPAAMLTRLGASLKPHGEIIVEVPSAEDALMSLYRSEAFLKFTLWSCHLFLFNPSNVRLLAGKAGLKLRDCVQVQRYPLSNHLYWLSKGAPGGHKDWPFLDSPEMRALYEGELAKQGKCDTVMFTLVRP